ncbi:MAG TPA: DUF6445 family protein [Sphingomicrobium sp.]
MKAELKRFGYEQSPVVVIDEFSGDLCEILAVADALAPYPRLAGNYYPGIRRIFGPADDSANAYAIQLCNEAGQFIAGAFDIDSFTLLEASFSMVTARGLALSPAQRAPHFDSPNPKHLALLHYLHVPTGSGTAFYRQRSTGIERVTDDNLNSFVTTARTDAARLPPNSGYIAGSDDFFEQIGMVEAIADRLIIYQGSLLHSGIIPETMKFSDDPRRGRLTANLFVQGS